MKVTIVTPSFNQAAFLEQTMLSVIRQDYPDLEYLVIDGGSTDGSPEIIQKYTEQLSWWVSERDSGQAEAINKGLARASGEIVAWLNSDDLYLPNAVSSAVRALQTNPQVGMVFGNAITIDTNGHPLNSLVFADWDLIDLMSFRIICQPAVFMRRSVLEMAASETLSSPEVRRPNGTTVPAGTTVPNGTTVPYGTTVPHFLNPDLHYMLDHHLWLRMARLAPIQHIDLFLAAARHHPGAKNVSQAPGFGRETLLLLEWMQQEPEYASLVASHLRRIQGGAYRLNARYLLDGDMPGRALYWYMKALAASPAYALRHWHRMLYAALKWVGLKRIANGMNSARVNSDIFNKKRFAQISPQILSIYKEHPDWPGLRAVAHPPIKDGKNGTPVSPL